MPAAKPAPVTARASGGIAIEAAFELGVVHVARALWAKLGIGEAIQARVAGQRLQAPHAAALLAMVAQRLDRPGSKLACHERWLDRVWLPEARDLGLHQLYRALDLLAEHGDAVEQAVFWRAADLFKLDVDLVFYDGTTAWFEMRRGGRRRPRVARADLRAAAPARAQQGGAGQRPAGGDRARGHPRRRAGALLGVPGRHARRHHGAEDQGRPARDAARPGPVRRRRRAVLEGQPRRAGQGGRALRPGRADRAGEGDPGRGPVPSGPLRRRSRPACGPRRWCSARASAAGATSCA